MADLSNLKIEIDADSNGKISELIAEIKALREALRQESAERRRLHDRQVHQSRLASD